MNTMIKPLFLTFVATLCLSACQATKAPVAPTPVVNEQIINEQPTDSPALNTQPRPISFDITGKLSLISQTAQGKKATTAFYNWVQDDQQFAIDLAGAFGIGATSIRFDGQTATLNTTGQTQQADNPSQLLYKTTGLFAPIETLPYWVMGQVADGDTNSHYENHRLSQSTNGDWTAVFEYDNNPLPTRLKLSHQDGHKITLLINHKSKR